MCTAAFITFILKERLKLQFMKLSAMFVCSPPPIIWPPYLPRKLMLPQFLKLWPHSRGVLWREGVLYVVAAVRFYVYLLQRGGIC